MIRGLALLLLAGLAFGCLVAGALLVWMSVRHPDPDEPVAKR